MVRTQPAEVHPARARARVASRKRTRTSADGWTASAARSPPLSSRPVFAFRPWRGLFSGPQYARQSISAEVVLLKLAGRSCAVLFDFACLDQPHDLPQSRPTSVRRIANNKRVGFWFTASQHAIVARPRSSPHGQFPLASHGSPRAGRHARRFGRIEGLNLRGLRERASH